MYNNATVITVRNGQIVNCEGPNYISHDNTHYVGNDWAVKLDDIKLAAQTPAEPEAGRMKVEKYKPLRDGVYVLTGGDILERRVDYFYQKPSWLI